MTQSNSLGYMPCACPPHHGVLKRLLERPVDLIADLLDGRFVSNDECLAEVWLLPLPAP